MKKLKKPNKVDEKLMISLKQQSKSLEKLLKTDEKLEKAWKACIEQQRQEMKIKLSKLFYATMKSR